ncbi:hypothetical protein NEHOM01_1148 [Nematocida homosporus]|uniref:uncharacterized protein n=1 Tax=Nematocida homosporus TaxID=1912981 RepID=UPI00221EDAC2|nr:uncharacterized protein NEHOM01_1148 [Nematocida homosporus]KAI5185898.1 hypothetical protein NEHOM01_1148 [Nematocida homosporus]
MADRRKQLKDDPGALRDLRQIEETMHKRKDDLEMALKFLTYSEDTEEFLSWEDFLGKSPSWQEMSSAERIRILLQNGLARDLARFHKISHRLRSYYREISDLEEVEPESVEVHWDTVRSRMIEIFSSAEDDRLELPHFKKGESLTHWALHACGLYAAKALTWAQLVKKVEKTVPHPSLIGKVFDPSKPEMQRFVDVCRAIDRKEQTQQTSQTSTTKKSGGTNSRLNLVCTYCKKKGHKEEECFTKKNKESKETKPKAKLTSLEPQMRTNIPLPEEDKVELEGPCIAEFTLGSGKPMSGTYGTGSQLNVINWEMYEQLVQEQGPIQCYEPEITSLYNVNGKEVRTESLIVMSMSVKGVEVGRQQFYIIRNKRLDQPLIGLPAIRAYESRIDALKTKVQLDQYPIPGILTITDALRDTTAFSKIDLKEGFVNVPLRKSERVKTTITSTCISNLDRVVFSIEE